MMMRLSQGYETDHILWPMHEETYSPLLVVLFLALLARFWRALSGMAAPAQIQYKYQQSTDHLNYHHV